jgi:integrase
MSGRVFRRCTSCGARFKPNMRRCQRCDNTRSTWAFVVDVGAPGQRRQRMRGGFETRDDAARALRELLVDDDANVDPSELTVEQYLRRWLDGLRRRPNTVADYTQSLTVYVIPVLGRVKLQRLTAEHLDGLYSDLLTHGRRDGTGLAPKSVRNVHVAVHAALQTALERGHVRRNVAGMARPPRARDTRSRATERVWSAEQVRRFLVAAAVEWLYPCLHLLTHTGLRRGECVALDWSDVDLDAAELCVRDAKTAAGERTVGLDAGTVAVLREWRRRQVATLGDDRPVFTDEYGRRVKPDRVYRTVIRLGEQAGLPRLDAHGLRHTWATNALRAGVPVHVVARHLGHKDPSVTLRTYAHALRADSHTAAAAVAAMYGGTAGTVNRVSIP